MAQDHCEKGSTHTGPKRILPNDFSKCKLVVTLLSGSLPPDHKIICDKEIETTIGNAENEVTDQIEVTLMTMTEGELKQITVDTSSPCKSTAAANNEGFVEKTNSDSDTIIGVKLVSFQREKNIWDLAPHERHARAQHLKERGVELFKMGRYEMAFRKFSRALKYSILVGKEPPKDIHADCNTLKCQCYLNLGACQLQKENYSSVIDNCSKALCLDVNNVKGLYRRAQALYKLDDFSSAVEDLTRAKILEPGNKAVVRLLSSAQVSLKKQEEKLASCMSKMFV